VPAQDSKSLRSFLFSDVTHAIRAPRAASKAFGRYFGDLHIHPNTPGPEGHPENSLLTASQMD
jgi:hypothetical protein